MHSSEDSSRPAVLLGARDGLVEGESGGAAAAPVEAGRYGRNDKGESGGALGRLLQLSLQRGTSGHEKDRNRAAHEEGAANSKSAHHGVLDVAHYGFGRA